ncbi:thioesterase family protein [Salinactinospora qingdaonensis]|uniref:Fluoroacetyl-CoA-specific thioesterase-like domain-containing protein n=1 Tax=Salinactinospora qingdaonensis TaxID=702744 RepID=A0ABP7GE54_9ACTN
MAISAGLHGNADLDVTTSDTAVALGSGDVAVLGTPRVLALAEAATVAAVAGHLPQGCTSVGTQVEVAHTAPTPIGAQVHAEAVLSHVAGEQLTFDVTVTQQERTIATATVRRVIVERERFLAKATA